MTTIYLDNNATTRVPQSVIDAMTPYYSEHYGNPHAVHALGRRAHDGVEEGRAEAAALVGCATEELIFTSCGTEGNAIVVRGLLDGKPERRRIVATAVEHPSVLSLLRALADAGEIELSVVGVGRDGSLDLDRLREAVDTKTLLVCAMLAQNETGVLHPVAAIGEIAHAAGSLLLVDAVQAAGKIPVSFAELGADFLTISGHKFHAPKGIGALAMRAGIRLRPLWYGGGQELGMRSGTEAVAAIAGLSAASRLSREALARMSEVARRRERLESGLLERIESVSINGVSQPRLPNTASVAFHGVPGDALVRALDANGICVSAGAACHSGKVEPSATMRAMGLPLDVAMGAVRFSLSRYTTDEEIEAVLNTVPALVSGLRG